MDLDLSKQQFGRAVPFEALLPHLDRMEPCGKPERGQSTMFNNLKHLPVSLR